MLPKVLLRTSLAGGEAVDCCAPRCGDGGVASEGGSCRFVTTGATLADFGEAAPVARGGGGDAAAGRVDPADGTGAGAIGCTWSCNPRARGAEKQAFPQGFLAGTCCGTCLAWSPVMYQVYTSLFGHCIYIGTGIYLAPASGIYW